MVTGPENIKDAYQNKFVKELTDKIESELTNLPQLYDWVEVIVDGDYSKDVRNKVAKEYLEAGWSVVYHQTSFENGERAGLTAFALLDDETCKIFERNHDTSKWTKWVNVK